MSDTVSRKEFDDLRKKVETMGLEKVKKDRPKRAPSAYNLFVGKESKKIKKENPTLTFAEVSKKVGESWRTSSENPKTLNQFQKKRLKKKRNK